MIKIETLNELPTNEFLLYMGDPEKCLEMFTEKYGEPKEVYLYINKTNMRFIYILGD